MVCYNSTCSMLRIARINNTSSLTYIFPAFNPISFFYHIICIICISHHALHTPSQSLSSSTKRRSRRSRRQVSISTRVVTKQYRIKRSFIVAIAPPGIILFRTGIRIRCMVAGDCRSRRRRGRHWTRSDGRLCGVLVRVPGVYEFAAPGHCLVARRGGDLVSW